MERNETKQTALVMLVDKCKTGPSLAKKSSHKAGCTTSELKCEYTC